MTGIASLTGLVDDCRGNHWRARVSAAAINWLGDEISTMLELVVACASALTTVVEASVQLVVKAAKSAKASSRGGNTAAAAIAEISIR